jgi:hypothetical protein
MRLVEAASARIDKVKLGNSNRDAMEGRLAGRRKRFLMGRSAGGGVPIMRTSSGILTVSPEK